MSLSAEKVLHKMRSLEGESWRNPRERWDALKNWVGARKDMGSGSVGINQDVLEDRTRMADFVCSSKKKRYSAGDVLDLIDGVLEERD